MVHEGEVGLALVESLIEGEDGVITTICIIVGGRAFIDSRFRAIL